MAATAATSPPIIHIFRFDNNKIVELWDLGQSLPAEQINENGIF